jgi:hypothetical protein
MKRIVLLLIITALGCNPRFIKYKATVSEADLPESCKGLIGLLEEGWSKRKGRKCHYYNGIEVKIQNRYKDCLTGMTKEQVQSIFGEPDAIERSWIFFYNFHKTCPKQMRSYNQLRIEFKDGKVSAVEWSAVLPPSW